jgi:hypothetical protein
MASCRVREEVLEHGTVVPASMVCPEIDGVKALEVRATEIIIFRHHHLGVFACAWSSD